MRCPLTEYEMMYDILHQCKKPQMFTYLMGVCSLSYKSLTRCLTTLIDRDLISQVKNSTGRLRGRKGRFYKTTDEGLKYIKIFNKLKDMCGE